MTFWTSQKSSQDTLNSSSIKFDLHEVLDKATELMALRAQEKGLEILVSVASDVPISLIGDPHRLRQVIVNLVGNAIKFTERGEVTVRVTNDNGANRTRHVALRCFRYGDWHSI